MNQLQLGIDDQANPHKIAYLTSDTMIINYAAMDETEFTSGIKFKKFKLKTVPLDLLKLNQSYDRILVFINTENRQFYQLLMYRIRQYLKRTGKARIYLPKDDQSKGEILEAARLYYRKVTETSDALTLSHAKNGVNAIDWGDDPFMFGPRDYFRNSLILNELRRFPKIHSVYDYGCGVGNMLFRLAGFGYNMTGSDISDNAINFVKQQISDRKLGNQIKVKQGIVETLHVKSNSFDAIWCCEVLEHIPQELPVAKFFYRILKPGGYGFISVPYGMQFWDDIDEYSGHYRRYSEAEIKTIFEKVGLKVERVIYWGFPLNRLWDMLVYYRLFRQKVTQNEKYSREFSWISSLLHRDDLIKLFSVIFHFDRLFNWTKLGKGIILVVKKS
jgi:2-polyprenyl-3-methyl-5-hydroxy-6-metoxy-1,4-benzoquinol methylase